MSNRKKEWIRLQLEASKASEAFRTGDREARARALKVYRAVSAATLRLLSSK